MKHTTCARTYTQTIWGGMTDNKQETTLSAGMSWLNGKTSPQWSAAHEITPMIMRILNMAISTTTKHITPKRKTICNEVTGEHKRNGDFSRHKLNYCEHTRQ